MSQHEEPLPFQLPLRAEQLPDVLIRLELAIAARKACEVAGNADEIRYYCALLFSTKTPQTVTAIWNAKQADADLGFAIDPQLLCGGGFGETMRYLSKSDDSLSLEIRSFLADCEQCGNFTEFDPDTYLDELMDYYS